MSRWLNKSADKHHTPDTNTFTFGTMITISKIEKIWCNRNEKENTDQPYFGKKTGMVYDTYNQILRMTITKNQNQKKRWKKNLEKIFFLGESVLLVGWISRDRGGASFCLTDYHTMNITDKSKEETYTDSHNTLKILIFCSCISQRGRECQRERDK